MTYQMIYKVFGKEVETRKFWADSDQDAKDQAEWFIQRTVLTQEGITRDQVIIYSVAQS